MSLDDFTHVGDKLSSVPGTTTVVVCAVYLSTEEGFKNYCENCSFCLMVQEIGSSEFKHRVFCGAQKCQK